MQWASIPNSGICGRRHEYCTRGGDFWYDDAIPATRYGVVNMTDLQSRALLRHRLRQLILMRETGPKRPAWHLQRMRMIWALHDQIAALDGGETPMFPQTLRDYLTPQLDAYIEELRQLCAIECPTSSKEGVDEAGEWVARWGRRRNWEVKRWKDDTAGDSIAFTILGKGGPRILLAAHLDTVYPVGVAAERPMRIDGNTLLAPGSCDNKSGLQIGRAHV